MASSLRYGGRKLSFDVLSDDYDNVLMDDDEEKPLYRSVSDSFPKKRKKKTKKKKLTVKEIEEETITEKRVDAVFDDDDDRLRMNGVELDYQTCSIQTVICEEIRVPENESIRTVHQVLENGERFSIPLVEMRRRSRPPSGNVDEFVPAANEDNVVVNGDRHSPFVEVRRRSRPPSGSIDEAVSVVNEDNAVVKEETKTDLKGQSRLECGFGPKLEKDKSLDWKQLMKEDSDFSSMERSPVQYFMGKIYYGNSLESTTILGSEKERERVYDAMLHLPWRCERIIAVGYLVCLDSFLSLLTIMPARVVMAFWRFISTWQFWMPSAGELSDFGCFIVLVCGVTLLQQADISLIYHMIRGQGTIKLYVVYNVLEIFDRLCQNFGGDVFQALFSSAKGLSYSLPENKSFWMWRFVADQALTIVSSILHSFILLAQAITLSTCIVSHNNALLALLVSNNFAEIKSNVFKRFSKDNVHSMVYCDSIERFHISAFILFVLAQNLLEAEGPWFGSFLLNASLVFSCEILIDIIKHSFIAKFNEIKPIAYSEFLEDLCKQTLNMQPDETRKNLTFVPLAPACVVIRVLTPVYAAHLPYGPLPWRLLWIFLLSVMTYVMLASLKVMVGMGLHKFATWYVSRCQIRKLHSD